MDLEKFLRVCTRANLIIVAIAFLPVRLVLIPARQENMRAFSEDDDETRKGMVCMILLDFFEPKHDLVGNGHNHMIRASHICPFCRLIAFILASNKLSSGDEKYLKRNA